MHRKDHKEVANDPSLKKLMGRSSHHTAVSKTQLARRRTELLNFIKTKVLHEVKRMFLMKYDSQLVWQVP